MHILGSLRTRMALAGFAAAVLSLSGAALPNPTTVRPGLSAPAPASDSRALFNKIFQQYAAGASIVAAWKDAGASKPFKVEELRDEPAR